MHVAVSRYAGLLDAYLRPQRWRVALLAALLFGSIGAQLVGPQILRYFVDAARAGAALDLLTQAALIYLGFALLQQVLAVGATYLGEDVGWAATNAVRADLARHCLKLDLSFHKVRTPGEMIERVDGDVTALATFFSQFAIRVLGNALLLVGVLVLLFREDWRVGLAFTLFAIGALIALDRIRGIAIPHWTAARQTSADLFGFVEERLAGTEDIRSNRLQPHVMRRFYQLLRERVRKERIGGFMGSVVGATFWGLFTVAYVFAFVLGGYLYWNGLITLGTVFLIFAYTELLQRPLNQITSQIEQLQKAGAAITRIDELLAIHPRLPEPADSVPLPSGALSVAFERVSFAYEGDEVVLDDLSFRLAPGRSLGLLGRTGSGKTTIARLLFRFYDPSAGTIRLGSDGAAAEVDVRQVALADLRRRIGLVSQDVQLFRASVRDNLTFFDPSVPDDRVREALERVGLAAWLRALPAGLDAELAPGGAGLSAGEGQLLAFARVLLRDPGLVVLDEASSRLDPATERLIERAVDQLLRDRTAIVIAHRLATVERVDDILILEVGRVVEHGARSALAAKPGSRYSRLVRRGRALGGDGADPELGAETPVLAPGSPA